MTLLKMMKSAEDPFGIVAPSFFTKSSLMPEGNERMARRRQLQLVDEVEETGCGSEHEPVENDGAALRPILPLPVLNGHANGSGHAASN